MLQVHVGVHAGVKRTRSHLFCVLYYACEEMYAESLGAVGAWCGASVCFGF